MLAAAVVRDEKVRSAFEIVGWVNLSQAPDLSRLQGRLYQQLTLEKSAMPDACKASIQMQGAALKEIALQKRILVVCDDLWDASHVKAFDIIDEKTASRLMITTR